VLSRRFHRGRANSWRTRGSPPRSSSRKMTSPGPAGAFLCSRFLAGCVGQLNDNAAIEERLSYGSRAAASPEGASSPVCRSPVSRPAASGRGPHDSTLSAGVLIKLPCRCVSMLPPRLGIIEPCLPSPANMPPAVPAGCTKSSRQSLKLRVQTRGAFMQPAECQPFVRTAGCTGCGWYGIGTQYSKPHVHASGVVSSL
jgi:hypothetical protein